MLCIVYTGIHSTLRRSLTRPTCGRIFVCVTFNVLDWSLLIGHKSQLMSDTLITYCDGVGWWPVQKYLVQFVIGTDRNTLHMIMKYAMMSDMNEISNKYKSGTTGVPISSQCCHAQLQSVSPGSSHQSTELTTNVNACNMHVFIRFPEESNSNLTFIMISIAR